MDFVVATPSEYQCTICRNNVHLPINKEDNVVLIIPTHLSRPMYNMILSSLAMTFFFIHIQFLLLLRTLLVPSSGVAVMADELVYSKQPIFGLTREWFLESCPSLG